MAITLIVFAVLAFLAELLGPRLFDVFGLVVDCAMFWFPLGLTGLVLVGVALLFLVRPRHSIE
jgi:hypothetical protein